MAARNRKAASGRAPTIRKRRRKWLLLRIQKATIRARAICSLRLLADVPFASCTSCHVVASLRGRIRRQGATCHTQDACIVPRRCYTQYMTRTVGASCLHCWSAFQRAVISKHRYGVIGLTWRGRSAASDGGKTDLITVPLKVSRYRLRLAMQTPHLGRPSGNVL
jgi:hypothetical protein